MLVKDFKSGLTPHEDAHSTISAPADTATCTEKHGGPPLAQPAGHVDDRLGPPGSPVDAVEAALGNAVELAAREGRWDVVVELGRVLAERQRLRPTTMGIVELDAERARRGRSG